MVPPNGFGEEKAQKAALLDKLTKKDYNGSCEAKLRKSDVWQGHPLYRLYRNSGATVVNGSQAILCFVCII